MRPTSARPVYQLAGPGRSRQRVVYDPRRIADSRAWLTERLGPLAYFAEVEAEQPAAEAPQVEAETIEPTHPVVAAEPVEAEPATEPIDWRAILDAARPMPPSPRMIPLGSLPADEISICTGFMPPGFAEAAARTCEWIVDTTGERIRRCGVAAHDGRDYCPEHRQQHTAIMSGTAPLPFGPFPVAPVTLMAAE